MGNFFDAVRSRKDPICPVEAGHLSAAVGHLIVIALRTGRVLQWKADDEKFVGEGAKDANAHLARRMRKPYDYGFAGQKTKIAARGPLPRSDLRSRITDYGPAGCGLRST